MTWFTRVSRITQPFNSSRVRIVRSLRSLRITIFQNHIRRTSSPTSQFAHCTSYFSSHSFSPLIAHFSVLTLFSLLYYNLRPSFPRFSTFFNPHPVNSGPIYAPSNLFTPWLAHKSHVKSLMIRDLTSSRYSRNSNSTNANSRRRPSRRLRAGARYGTKQRSTSCGSNGR